VPGREISQRADCKWGLVPAFSYRNGYCCKDSEVDEDSCGDHVVDVEGEEIQVSERWCYLCVWPGVLETKRLGGEENDVWAARMKCRKLERRKFKGAGPVVILRGSKGKGEPWFLL